MGDGILTPNDIFTSNKYAATGETFDLPLSSVLSAVAATVNNQTAYTVATENDLHNLTEGMEIVIAGCTDSANNDGNFKVTKLDYVNLKVYVNNTKGTAESPVGAALTITKKARAIHVATPEGGGIAADIEGNVAHDAVDSGKPVKIGGKAHTSAPSVVADGDRVNAYFDEYGRLHTVDEGGSSTLPATHRNPQDFNVAYISNVTITASGAPFSVDDSECFISYIYYKPTGSTWQSPLVNGVNGVSIASASNVITVTGGGTPFASSDEYLVGIIYQEKGYSSAMDANQSVELAPISEAYIKEVLVEETNESADTYRASFSMSGSKSASLQWDISGGVTLTVWATNNDDADTSADTDWEDITTQVTGNASEVDNSGIAFIDTNMMIDRIMIKRVTSDATNASDVIIKKGY